ncbi:hypothetical protein ACU5EH_03095 [Aliivibrio salmonicida]
MSAACSMRNELSEQEKQELVEDTAMLFLSRYGVGGSRWVLFLD